MNATAHRNNGNTTRRTPSQYQVNVITGRGLPVPPSYDEAQALMDSFEPSEAQQRRLDEVGLTATTRGEAKQVLAAFVEANPEIAKQWESQNAEASATRRQTQRNEGQPRATTPAMFQLLADAGCQQIPSDFAAAAALIDALAPSEEMVRVLREFGREVPATRAAASALIDTLPPTANQMRTILRATGGRFCPDTRGGARQWFARNPRQGQYRDAEMEAAA